MAVGVNVEIRRLSCYRAGRKRGVRAFPLCGKTLRRRAHNAGEHLIPHAISPAIKNAVPDYPLLLGAVNTVPPVNCESAMKPPLAKDGLVQ